MSTVYRAHDTWLDVHRAIKVLSPELASRRTIRRRFELEARTMARLRHPNIVTVHDVGFDAQALFLVLELVDGGTLMDVVAELGPLPARTACALIRDVCSALQCAHDLGVVHRDVKPHNVLLTLDAVPKVADFGIARLSDEVERPGDTRSGIVMGTWAYMAPEQRSSARAAEPRSDIYAAGATLYTLLTGKEPLDLFATAADDELRSEVYEGIPAPVAGLIERATRYRAKDRFETAQEMADAARAILPALPADRLDLVAWTHQRTPQAGPALGALGARNSFPGRPPTGSGSDGGGPAPGRTELPWAGGTATPAPADRAVPPLRRATPAPAAPRAAEIRRPLGVASSVKPALARRRHGPTTPPPMDRKMPSRAVYTDGGADPDSVATPMGAAARSASQVADLYGIPGGSEGWDRATPQPREPRRPEPADRRSLYGGEIGPEDPTSVDEQVPDLGASGPALLYDPDAEEADVVAFLPGTVDGHDDDPFANMDPGYTAPKASAPAPAQRSAIPRERPILERPTQERPAAEPAPDPDAPDAPPLPLRPATPMPAKRRSVRVRPRRHPIVLGAYLIAGMAVALVVSALATAQVLRSPPPPQVQDVPLNGFVFLDPSPTPAPAQDLLVDPMAAETVSGLPAGHGLLWVDARPRAIVRLGSGTYSTPFQSPLPFGAHTVTIESPRGEKAERIVTVSEGTKTSYCHDFTKDGPCD